MDESQDLGWLIRDTSNRIRGPFKQSEIVQLIKKGQLKGKTEVSRANSYWFAVEEKVELARFLPEFNGGKPAPEQPTQMTATLTEADIQDRGVEITQFTAVPTKKELEQEAQKSEQNETAPDALTSGTQQIEWLSDEFAEEFGGDDYGVTVSMQTDTGIDPLPAEAPQAPKEQPTPNTELKIPANKDEKARQEMLKRATVKADTLPSEHKSFQGDRPKPIDTLMRVRSNQGKDHQSALVNVPVEPEPAPKMFLEEDEAKVRARQKKRGLLIGAVLCALLVFGLFFYFLNAKATHKLKGDSGHRVRKGEEAAGAIRQSIILFDLDGAKTALADLELEPNSKGEASLFLAQAVVKKEFLFDVEGAVNSLQSAKAVVRNKRAESEVDNLLAVYSFDRDSGSASEMLRKNLDANKEDPIFRYNLALSLIRTGRPQEAIPLLEAMLPNVVGDSALAEDAALAHGWALESLCGSTPRDPACRRADGAEEAFGRALQANPQSAKARLGMGLFHLRRGGIKAADGDFRAFLDSAADLDPPSRISNFRKLPNSDFYNFAHSQIVDLNTPGPNVAKPSYLIMAADAMISGMQLRTSEAGKILEGALSAAPGDSNVLKALGYLRWKDGQLNELVDALKESKEHNSFAVNFMLGKAYLKLRKRDQAEKYARALMELFPARSEGFSLLGELLLEQPESLDDAKAQFQMALKKDPLDLVAWRGLQKANAPIVLSPDIQKNLPF